MEASLSEFFFFLFSESERIERVRLEKEETSRPQPLCFLFSSTFGNGKPDSVFFICL
jgi:hypothetical protein